MADLFCIHGKSVTLKELMAAVWIIGIFINTGKMLHSYLSCKRKLKNMPPADSSEILSVFDKTFSHIFSNKINRCTIINSNIFGTAAIWGFRNPIIILPDVNYSENELYYVFFHELLHLKHKDHLIKILCSILAAVHWWNPLISHLLIPAINQMQELLVDYQVSSSLTTKEKIHYLECIKKTAAYTISVNTKRTTFHALGNGNSKRNILQRFKLIMEQKTARYTVKGIVLTGFFFLMSFTFVFEPCYNDYYDENDNEVFCYFEWRHDNYYIKNGTKYDLYLNDRYVYTSDIIIDDFKELPVYEEDKK